MSDSPILQKHREFLFPAAATDYREPITLAKGAGMQVWDGQNNCFGGVFTGSVGHAHPTVTAAVVEQMQNPVHASALCANGPQSDFAEKLAQLAPGDLKKSFFTSSGTEANDIMVLRTSISWLLTFGLGARTYAI